MAYAKDLGGASHSLKSQITMADTQAGIVVAASAENLRPEFSQERIQSQRNIDGGQQRKTFTPASSVIPNREQHSSKWPVQHHVIT